MKLIIGGAYQGKRDFAVQNMQIAPENIFACENETIDFSKPCVDKLEEFVFACVQKQLDPVAILRENKAAWENTVFICQDMSSGVVPLGADMRQWRQSTGLVCQYLAREAESVHRVFCGLEHRLK